jgi:MFS family permease
MNSGLPPKQLFVRNLIRPSKMLILSPIVALMSIYIAVLYGFLYILFTTFTLVFEGQYGFSASSSGLSFLGSGVGMLLGLAYVGTLSDRKIRIKVERKETPVPEDRLPMYLTIPGSLAIPAGLFLYGWSTDKVVHWIVPEIGNAVIGFGMITILMCVQTYLVDAFLAHAASAVAACTVLRSLLGALLPLCGLQIYEKLGLGWGNSFLAFLALAMAPIPILFETWGEKLRTRKTIEL